MRVSLVLTCLLTWVVTLSQSYPVTAIPPELLKNANSVVRFNDMELRINNERSMVVTSREVVTILNKNGRNDLYTGVWYDKENKVKSVELFVFDQNGKEVEHIKKRDFIDVSAVSDVALYSDDRNLLYNYTPKEYPYTMEFIYTMEFEDTGFIVPFMPIGTTNSSVQNATHTIIIPQASKLKYKIVDPLGVVKEAIGTNTYKFSVSNLPAYESEEFGLSFKESVPWVRFGLEVFSLKGEIGSSKDWGDFGKWYQSRLLHDVSGVSEATKQKIKNLVQGVEDPIERAKKVYQYVQDHTRYINVSIGIGGWKPFPAHEVDRLGYGDCKGLTNFTKTLMDIAEVPSYYTIVQAGGQKEDILSDFTSIQGNHVILAIPNGDTITWLECTSQNIPFGFIGDFTDDRDVLMITENGGKITHTKKYSSHDNWMRTNGEVSVDEDGDIKVSAVLESSGIQYDNRYWIESQKQDDKERFYKNYWRYIDNISIKKIEIINNRDNVELKEKIDFEAHSFASLAGEKMILNINVLDQLNMIPKRYKERNQPVRIQRGNFDQDSITVHLPKGYTLTGQTEPIAFDSKFGTYRSSIKKINENQLLYERTFELFEGTYPKEDYNDFRNFMKQVTNNDGQKLILVKL